MTVMADPLITLTTDFGTASPYVAAVKGVVLALNPAARLIDLTLAGTRYESMRAALDVLVTAPEFDLGWISLKAQRRSKKKEWRCCRLPSEPHIGRYLTTREDLSYSLRKKHCDRIDARGAGGRNRGCH